MKRLRHRTAVTTGGASGFGQEFARFGVPLVARAREADHDARAFLRLFNRFPQRPLARSSLAELRLSWRLLALALGRRVDVASVSEHSIGTPAGPIRLRVFDPAPAAGLRPALLWCHGGGFVLGSLDTADSICRNLARRTGAIVVAVGYRLAPEHGLHAGREDFLAALRWVAAQGASLGIDASRLAVGGDSAGGNIAAAVAQQVARTGGPALCLQLLAYPATDLLRQFPSMAENARGHLLTDEFIGWSQSLIADSRIDLADPWLSPALRPDLSGLPPALIVSAGFDPIRDDGIAYAARLRDAGVPVELLHYPGQFHGFLNFDSVIGAARDALERAGRSLAGAFAGMAVPDRTLEVGDAAPRDAQALHEVSRKATHEWAGTTLMAWTCLAQWNAALLRLASPGTAAAVAQCLKPWLAPAAWAQRSAFADLQRLDARQTHPPTADTAD